MRCTCVSTQMFFWLSIRENQHQVRGLAADTRQRQQLVHGRGRLAAEIPEQLRAGRLDVARLVAVEADRIDQLLDLLDGQLRHRLRRAGLPEQPLGCRVCRGVLRSRGQQRRDGHLKRIFRARLGDLLDRRELEPGDGDGSSRCRITGGRDRFLARAAAYGIGVIGGWPLRTFTTFRATRSYIAARVSAVALAMCGTSTTFSSASRPG